MAMSPFVHNAVRAALVAGIGWLAVPAALAADPCSDFKWDVHTERSLFESPAHPVVAGLSSSSAVPVTLDRLYQLQLGPQAEVAFAAAPAKKQWSDGAHAGLATFDISVAGSYRVALDAPVWIDVVANGLVVPSKDFQGAHGCNAPHKIVVFDLPVAQHVVLQLSGASSGSVRVAITRVPAPGTDG
jgi:hypothetical protein